MANAVHQVNGINFQQEVLESKVPVFVDVKTTWCGPCRMAAPVVHEIAEANAGKIKVVEIDGDESPDLVQQLRVRGFPTFIYFENGAKFVAPLVSLVSVLSTNSPVFDAAMTKKR